MTEEGFNKDSWIRLALHRGAINCDREGNIYVKKGDGWKRLKSQTHKPTGRVYVNITFMGKTKSVLVNRVVALKYLPNPENLPEVNHIDGVKAHNWVASLDGTRTSNLEWSNRSAQEKHAFATGLKSTRGSQNSNAKLTAQQVLEIRQLWEGGNTTQNLARIYGVATSTINGIVRRKTWTHV